MQGLLETLAEALFVRGLGTGLAAVLMATAPRKAVRVELKKIFVLDDSGELASEYGLDPDCPIEYHDFLRVLPETGIGDRESLFVGEYVFTAFQSERGVYVLLSRGRLNPEDFDWIALLLKAADAQEGGARPARSSEVMGASPDAAFADREARLQAREAELAQLEVKIKADEANLRGRAEELERQKAQLGSLTEQVAQRERQASASHDKGQADADSALAKAREEFTSERSSLLGAKSDLDAKYREALSQVESIRVSYGEATAALERERAEWTRRDADAAKLRGEIESRVQELSQRFASMAKERLLQSHKGSAEPPDAVKQAIDLEKAQLAKERKFLQNRAIEILDMQERVTDREAKIAEREAVLGRRGDELTSREAEIAHAKAVMAQASVPTVAPSETPDDTRRDLDRRVKVIQQKALDLLDREEKLRRRAEELQTLEDRLMGRVPAK